MVKRSGRPVTCFTKDLEETMFSSGISLVLLYLYSFKVSQENYHNFTAKNWND